MRRPNLHLFDEDTGFIYVHPHTGALHESGRLWLGPPKTAESARTISLPPFLVRLLRAHLDTHTHEHVFVTPTGQLQRRSNLSRNAMRPAADGNLTVAKPRVRLQPACPGLTFHGLRHGHKSWMIADSVPEAAQAARLGHALKDKIQRTYSHVAAEVEDRLLQGLQDRWGKAVANSPDDPDTALARGCRSALITDFTDLRGGLLVVADGVVVGGIAASGSSSGNDIAIAQAGLDALID